MPKFKCKEELVMFDDDILEKIFSHPDVKDIPISEQSIMIRVIEQVLEQMEVK